MKERTGDLMVQRICSSYIPLLSENKLSEQGEYTKFCWNLVIFWCEVLTPDDEDTSQETNWLQATDLSAITELRSPERPQQLPSSAQRFAESLVDWGDGGWIYTILHNTMAYFKTNPEEFMDEIYDEAEKIALELAVIFTNDLLKLGMTEQEFESILRERTEG